MQTWVKATLGAAGLVLLAMLAIGGTGAYFVLSHLERTTLAEAESRTQIDTIRARFPPRAPLLEIVDPLRGDIRINRADRDSPVRPSTLHVISWNADTDELVQTEAPLWLMRFSTANVLSQLGVGPQRFRLTVDDVQRYGPGIIVDYNLPDKVRVLVWVE
jgi:hypothetical protein